MRFSTTRCHPLSCTVHRKVYTLTCKCCEVALWSQQDCYLLAKCLSVDTSTQQTLGPYDTELHLLGFISKQRPLLSAVLLPSCQSIIQHFPFKTPDTCWHRTFIAVAMLCFSLFIFVRDTKASDVVCWTNLGEIFHMVDSKACTRLLNVMCRMPRSISTVNSHDWEQTVLVNVKWRFEPL